jgi:hypothetical protein
VSINLIRKTGVPRKQNMKEEMAIYLRSFLLKFKKEKVKNYGNAIEVCSLNRAIIIVLTAVAVVAVVVL